MTTLEPGWATRTSLTLALTALSSVVAQEVIIGPSTRNGSFESGIAAPWYGDFAAVENSSFASHGGWYALAQNTTPWFPALFQNLKPDAAEGLAFVLAFDARVGTPTNASLSTRMAGRTIGGASLAATVSAISTPPLSASAWHHYQYRLEMPGAWDSAGVTFAILFADGSIPGGLRPSAYYLDNITLSQIPEPGALQRGAEN